MSVRGRDRQAKETFGPEAAVIEREGVKWLRLPGAREAQLLPTDTHSCAASWYAGRHGGQTGRLVLPEDARGEYWFEEMPPDQVRLAVRQAVDAMLARVPRRLRLSGLYVRYFRVRDGSKAQRPERWPDLEDAPFLHLQYHDSSRALRGKVVGSAPGLIWLRGTLGPKEAAHTVAHEARHHWQRLRRFSRMLRDGRWAENDAESFAFYMMYGGKLREGSGIVGDAIPDVLDELQPLGNGEIHGGAAAAVRPQE